MPETTIDNLFWNLITNEVKPVCNHNNYKQWENETDKLKLTLEKCGQINIKPKTWEHEQYWGNDSPIILSKYPYHSCEIYRCRKCQQFFFHYIEYGGHGSQKRYRIIDVSLIDKKDFKPNKRSTIEYEPHKYSVAKYPDGTFELTTIRHDIGIGIDIRYIMNEQESLEYLDKGIDKFKERIADMKANFKNYKVNSWR